MALGFAECLSMKAECAVFWSGWGVVVTALVGLLTLVVAVLAWRTSRQAAKIAMQQHEEARAVRTAQARIIGQLLLHEVSALPARVRMLSVNYRRAGATSLNGDVSWLEVRTVIEDCQVPLLPSAEKLEDRIHNLPDALGADLATMIGHCRSLSAEAAAVSMKIRPALPIGEVGRSGFVYEGTIVLLDNVDIHLELFADMTIGFANAFRGFVFEDGAPL
ncbi:hypothetical protein I5W21_06785 [Stenotrophomonas maltophilia]|nr:hypothetical protein [Stenotrophomonas maltophilia]